MLATVTLLVCSLFCVLSASPASGVAPSESVRQPFAIAAAAPPEVDLVVRIRDGAALRAALERTGLAGDFALFLDEPALRSAWDSIAEELGVSTAELLDRLLGTDATFFAVGVPEWWQRTGGSAATQPARAGLEWAIVTQVPREVVEDVLTALGRKRLGGGWQDVGAQRLRVSYIASTGMLVIAPSARPILATRIRSLLVDGAGPRLGNTAAIVEASQVEFPLDRSSPTLELFLRHDSFGMRWTACVASLEDDVLRVHHRASDNRFEACLASDAGAMALDASLLDGLSDSGMLAVLESGRRTGGITWMTPDLLGLKGDDRDLLDERGTSASLVVVGSATSDSTPMAVGLQIRDPIGAIDDDERRLAERVRQRREDALLASPLESAPESPSAELLIHVVRAPSGSWRVIANDAAMLGRTVAAIERGGASFDRRLLSGGTLDGAGLLAALHSMVGSSSEDGERRPASAQMLDRALRHAAPFATRVESLRWARSIEGDGVDHRTGDGVVPFAPATLLAVGVTPSQPARAGLIDTRLEIRLVRRPARAGGSGRPASSALSTSPAVAEPVPSNDGRSEPGLRHDRFPRRP